MVSYGRNGGEKMATISVAEKHNLMNPNSLTFDERERDLEEIRRSEEKARKREKNSPFGRWTQYNNEHTKEMMWLALKHPKAHAILLFLVDQMDNYNAVICSMQVLQEVLGIGRTTASNAIKVLKENGFIAVLKSGTSNVYAINDNVYWKSWGNSDILIICGKEIPRTNPVASDETYKSKNLAKNLTHGRICGASEDALE
jgi:DNA-binding transcriptional ArsR family regulator